MTVVEELPAVVVEFDVPAAWVRVELDHPETWRYLSEHISKSFATLQERGLEGDVDSSHLGSQMDALCQDLLKSGVSALVARSLVAVDEGAAVLITGMVTLALTVADPVISSVEQLRDASNTGLSTEAHVVSLPCGSALRVDIVLEGPGLLKPEPLAYRHTRYLVPIFGGRAVVLMVCSTPMAHADCFDLVFGQIAQSLRVGDGS